MSDKLFLFPAGQDQSGRVAVCGNRVFRGKLTLSLPALALLMGIFLQPMKAETSSSAHSLVAHSIEVLSVRRDLRTLKSMKVTAQSVSFDTVENDHPGAPYYATFSTGTVIDDFQNHKSLSESVNGTTTTRVLVTRDLIQNTTITDGKPAAPIVTLSPHSWETCNALRTLLLADTATDLELEKDVVRHEMTQHVVRFHHGPYLVRIFIDVFSGLPSATEATIDFQEVTSEAVAWNAWGDVVERTEYMNLNTVDGLRVTFQADIFRNGDIRLTNTITEAHGDVPLDQDAFAVLPQSEADAAALKRTNLDGLELGKPVASAPAVNLPIAEIAPGIVQIPGSWYTTLVHQADGIVVIDAPISAAYSKRVLDEAARRFPGVPVKAVIASTSFFWHIGGIREYAARGIPIYVCDANASTMQRLLTAPHTIHPDDLTRSPKAKRIVRPISARTVIGSGQNQIVLFPIRHATQNMLMTYIADARLLHTGEELQPFGPNGSFVSSESQLEITYAVRDAGITPDKVIGMHMSPTPWSKVGDQLRTEGVLP